MTLSNPMFPPRKAASSTSPARQPRKAQPPANPAQRPRLGDLAPGRGAPDFRALTTFESLPEQHVTFRVSEDGSAPHLREGEYAVIDTTDRELQNGELYVIQYESGKRSRHISQATSCLMNITGPDAGDSLVWWMRALRGFRRTSESWGGIPIFTGLSDGPYVAERLQSKLIGRVVGVATSPLGGLIGPTAGWENEEAGNAAFNAAEYIDVLLAAGFKPYVTVGRDGLVSSYYEQYPERRQTDAEDAAVMAVRWKYGAASTALDRVEQECLRRGLVYSGR